MKTKHLKAGLEYALNYHGIDARMSTPDHALADLIYLQVAHGIACSKRGLDPATAPYDQLSLDEMAETLRPVKTEQDIAALAERLAKVEDRQAALDRRQDRHDDRIDASEKQTRRRCGEIDKRIDGVATIFGDRVAELGDAIGSALDSAKRAHERIDDLRDVPSIKALIDSSVEPAFPTGGAAAAEAAAEAVLPVPQRGDRVRLEGALTTRGTPIKNGWYNVVGVDTKFLNLDALAIQISVTEPGADGAWLPWLYVNQAGLKEVRHADQH